MSLVTETLPSSAPAQIARERLLELPHSYEVVSIAPVEPTDPSQLTRYDVALSDLLGRGLLCVGEKLTMSWKPKGGDKRVFEGLVRDGGEIEVSGKLFTSPSYAALYALQSAGSSRTTQNGWVAWKTQDGVFLSSLRDQYLEALASPTA